MAWKMVKNLLKVLRKDEASAWWWAGALGLPLLFLGGAWLWARWLLPRRIVADADGLEIHRWNERVRLSWRSVRSARLVDRFWSPTRWILEDATGRTQVLHRLGLEEEGWEALGKILRSRVRGAA